MNEITTWPTPFEDTRLDTLIYRGAPAWIGRQVGTAIGYQRGGKRLVTKVTREWADEFIEGRDFAVLTGDEPQVFKELAGLGPDSVPSRAPSLLILFESGLHMALAKTNKAAGKRLRRFLVDEVLPQLVRDGKYLPARSVEGEEIGEPTIDHRLERERRQARKRELDDRKFRAGSLRKTIGTLRELGLIEAPLAATYEVAASEIALQRNLSVLKPPVEDDWASPTEIGRALGVSAQKVGRVITRLELRGNHPGLAKAIVNKAKGHQRTVVSYLYSPAAVKQIEAELTAGS